MAAAGGSYGGYMADWIGHTHGTLQAIISHASVYDKVAMYATEELWFEEHDMQGTPWTNPESYKKWAPGDVRGRAGKIQDAHAGDRGRKRLPRAVHAITGIFQRVAAAGSAFKAGGLPDEGHWVLKPQNAQFLVQDIFGLAGDVPEIKRQLRRRAGVEARGRAKRKR